MASMGRRLCLLLGAPSHPVIHSGVVPSSRTVLPCFPGPLPSRPWRGRSREDARHRGIPPEALPLCPAIAAPGQASISHAAMRRTTTRLLRGRRSSGPRGIRRPAQTLVFRNPFIGSPPLRQYGAEGRSRHVFQLTLLFLDGALYFRYLVGPLVHVLEYGHAELPVELGDNLLSVHVGDARDKMRKPSPRSRNRRRSIAAP